MTSATAAFPRSLSMSVAMWVKFPATGVFSDAGLVSMPGWGWSVNAAGTGVSIVMQTEYDWANGNTGLPYGLHDDRWHHVVLMNDSGPGFNNYSWGRVFVDGQFSGQFPMTYGGPPRFNGESDQPFSVSSAHGPGAFDEIAVWDRALSESEVARLFFGTQPCPTPPATTLATATAALGPLAYWSLDRSAGAGAIANTANSSAPPAECRPGGGQPSATAGVSGNAGWLQQAAGGPVFAGSDSGLGGVATMSWRMSIPATLAAGSQRLLSAGGGSITVDLHSTGSRPAATGDPDNSWNYLVINGNGCPYHGATMSLHLPAGLGDGNFHQIAIAYDIGAEWSAVAVDGQWVYSQAGEWRNSFVWRFCGNGSGSGSTWSIPAGGTIDEIVLLNRVATAADLETLGQAACPTAPGTGAQVCGSVIESYTLRFANGGYLGLPVGFQGGSGNTALRTTPFQWSKSRLDGFDSLASATHPGTCLRSTVSQNINPPEAGPVQYFSGNACTGSIGGDLLLQRNVQLSANRRTLSPVNENILIRNRQHIVSYADSSGDAVDIIPLCISAISDPAPAVEWQNCDAKAFAGTANLAVSPPLPARSSEADRIDNPASAATAPIGKIFVRTSRGWNIIGTGSLVATVNSQGEREVVLATAAHVTESGSPDRFLFVPATRMIDLQRGVYSTPYGVFAFEQADVQRITPRPNRLDTDVAFVTLSRQYLPPPASFSSSDASLDAAFENAIASRSIKANQLSIAAFKARMASAFPTTAQLAGAIVAGYPDQIFRAREMLVASGPARRRGGGANLPTALAGGASGGPLFVGSELVGVYAKSDPRLGGYTGIVALFRSDKHQALLQQAAERARTR
jgi:hypothetical protein